MGASMFLKNDRTRLNVGFSVRCSPVVRARTTHIVVEVDGGWRLFCSGQPGAKRTVGYPEHVRCHACRKKYLAEPLEDIANVSEAEA